MISKTDERRKWTMSTMMKGRKNYYRLFRNKLKTAIERPRRNILRVNVTRPLNFKGQDIMF